MRPDTPFLLVEDDPIDAMTVQRAFKMAGVERPLHVAENGREALDYLRGEGRFAVSPAPERPGMILLDLNMPLLNGVEFLDEIKSDPQVRQIPVVVLTTSDHHRDLSSCYERGVAGYIVKPVDFADFVKTVEAIDRYWSLSLVAEPQGRG
jgi:CheY-like chemotaxis protein